jgi:pimeloyl-ACP methyl ester carboxylesterase
MSNPVVLITGALTGIGRATAIIYTMNSFILQQNLPNAQLIIYPDSAHGSHHQYPELFVRHASMFLSGQGAA